MQKREGNVKLDDNGMIVDEARGFTERSLNILLQKIVEDESRQEAVALAQQHGNCENPDDENFKKEMESLINKKKPMPLIKTLYIRDPSRNNFSLIKYDREMLKNDA